MKFGEKVRQLRKEKNLSQTELGKMCGLSLRTIRNYEVDGRYPKQRKVYSDLAAALGCEVNFLLSEGVEFVLQAPQTCRCNSPRRAEDLVADILALFVGDELSEQDKDAVMRDLQNAYWMAKERNKEKYTPPKKYKEDLAVYHAPPRRGRNKRP